MPTTQAMGSEVKFQANEPVEASERSMALMFGRIEPTMTCWIWRGSIDEDGYGRFSIQLAHRVVYERILGPIPAGLQLDHLCRNRACVNPAHLEPVTPKENVRRSLPYRISSDRKPSVATHCKREHEYTDRDFRANGVRYCHACERTAKQKRRKKAKEISLKRV